MVIAFSYPYQASYGDAITVSFTLMRKGSLYTNQSRIIRPEPDKRLVMKWETFRDKLQPGTQETWTLHIARPSGMPAKANLMATLYDASLDAFRKHDWRFGLSFPRFLSRAHRCTYMPVLLHHTSRFRCIAVL